jgi:hypothetical protein
MPGEGTADSLKSRPDSFKRMLGGTMATPPSLIALHFNLKFIAVVKPPGATKMNGTNQLEDVSPKTRWALVGVWPHDDHPVISYPAALELESFPGEVLMRFDGRIGSHDVIEREGDVEGARSHGRQARARQ